MKIELNKIYQGDSLEVLKTFPDEGIDCVVTSPPYWGLRDYGTAKWEGGDEKCNHVYQTGGHLKDSVANTRGGSNKVTESQTRTYKDICGKCGAKRQDLQLGLEKTPEEYVAKMVEIFREIRRVLKKEGTCWLNLGDSYATSHETGTTDKAKGWTSATGIGGRQLEHARAGNGGLPSKNLIGIPWRVAFALQADGWYLRQDIIWAKPNPMPESVTDRCTKSHEYIFLLTKSPRYYFDSEAIKEPASTPFSTGGLSRATRSESTGKISGENHSGAGFITGENRNKRDVWTVTTKPYAESHFATFPQDLITPMVKAGCPPEGIVLDPFMGSGITAFVARSLGRNYLGIELNPDYIKLAEDRLSQEVLF